MSRVDLAEWIRVVIARFHADEGEEDTRCVETGAFLLVMCREPGSEQRLRDLHHRATRPDFAQWSRILIAPSRDEATGVWYFLYVVFPVPVQTLERFLREFNDETAPHQQGIRNYRRQRVVMFRCPQAGELARVEYAKIVEDAERLPTVFKMTFPLVKDRGTGIWYFIYQQWTLQP